MNFYRGSNRTSNKPYAGQSTVTGDNGGYSLEHKLDDEHAIIEYTLKDSVSALKEEAFTSFYLPESLGCGA